MAWCERPLHEATPIGSWPPAQIRCLVRQTAESIIVKVAPRPMTGTLSPLWEDSVSESSGSRAGAFVASRTLPGYLSDAPVRPSRRRLCRIDGVISRSWLPSRRESQRLTDCLSRMHAWVTASPL